METTTDTSKPRPREGDVVVWSTVDASGRFGVGPHGLSARMLLPTFTAALQAARSFAARIRTDAWSTADGRQFLPIAQHRTGRESTPVVRPPVSRNASGLTA